MIAALEGRPVAGVGQLCGRLDACRAGNAVKLQLLPEGKPQDVAATPRPGV